MENLQDKTREEIKQLILDNAKLLKKQHPQYRWGQAVFNYVDEYIGIAREVQFKDHIDCFYNDNMVDEFIEKVLNKLGK